MGYTHYWKQKRNLTIAQWIEVSADLHTILNHVQHEAGIALASGMSEGGTSPQFSDDRILFNGLGDDGHETFGISRKIDKDDWPFCKTARKPYDLAVTACLCYLSTVTRRADPATGEPIIGSEAFNVTSDGDGSDFLNGLALARAALPRLANILDLPMGVMQSDRWCAPWIDTSQNKTYQVLFCIDGKGYVLKPRGNAVESYCFESHEALAKFLERTKRADFKRSYVVRFGSFKDDYRIEPDIWKAYGSFDKERYQRIAKAQSKVLATLFPVDPTCAQQPPAYVRPGQMPENAGREFCYSITDLMNHLEKGKA